MAALAVAAALALAGCRADTTGLGTVEVAQLASWIDDGRDVVICDANNADTREKRGVIEGATLLTSYREYDLAGELPADKSRALVFYCHSEFCSAAAEAARRAMAAGYRSVHVMPAGIKGWLAEGHAVARPRTRSSEG